MNRRSILIRGSIILGLLILFTMLMGALRAKRLGHDFKEPPAKLSTFSAASDPDISSPSPMPPRLLRTLALNPDGYDPTKSSFAAEVLLGDLLFHSPKTLGPKAQALGISCQTCHANGATNQRFFLPQVSDRPGNADLSTAYFRTDADNGIADPVNIPTLRGVRYTGPYGHDGRTSSLAEFINQVVVSEFGGEPLSSSRLRALVSYVQEFDFLPNRNLDAIGRLSTHAGRAARTGERLFNKPRPAFAGGSCASCHIPTNFFRDGKSHRHGSANSASPFSLDDGRETPTLLDTFETAPYFHNGRFATLDEVVAWYNEKFRLGLTSAASSALVAYLKVIGSSETQYDDRPMARRLVESFSFLVLLLEGDAKDDLEIWSAGIDAVSRELATLREFPEISAGANSMVAKLASVKQQCAAGKPLAPLRSDVERIHRELNNLAPHWAGLVAASAKP